MLQRAHAAGGNTDCPIGSYCDTSFIGMCMGYECSSGVCSPQSVLAVDGGCELGFQGCNNGLACINALCGPCSTLADCQCGGGMACVQGTCGTCSASSQYGAHGTCTDGYCVRTSDQDCDTGERCGAGVCVAQ